MTAYRTALPINQLISGPAAATMGAWPAGSVDLIVTSPPYWPVECGEDSYEYYLLNLRSVWVQCARMLRPNGKLCINSASMPIAKKKIPGPLRALKCIPRDIWRSITDHTDLVLHDEVVWQKQNSTRPMFGSYPFGGNLIVNNTSEYIDIYLKPGCAPKHPKETREAMSQDLWLDLTQRSWWLYPEDVRRAHGHPSPFPPRLPARLIAMYTRPDEIVLDPFCGTGATCIAAKIMGRRYVGIDCNRSYLQIAEQRLAATERGELDLFVGRPGWPSKGARRG